MRLKNKSAKEFRRRTIIELHKKGLTQQQIAEIVGLAQSNISVFLKRYCEQGEAAIEISSSEGAQAKLNEQQLEALQTALDKGAEQHGFEGALWTRGRVKRLIEELFGVSYSERHVGRILKKLGFSRQKPKQVDYRQDPQQVSQWKEEDLPDLKKKLKPNNVA